MRCDAMPVMAFSYIYVFNQLGEGLLHDTNNMAHVSVDIFSFVLDVCVSMLKVTSLGQARTVCNHCLLSCTNISGKSDVYRKIQTHSKYS
jgi:hypothetical protein